MSSHRSGGGWRALALLVVPGLLLAAIVLPTALLWDRLPGHQIPPVSQDHPINWDALVWAYAAVFVTIWCGVVVLHLAALPGHRARHRVWGIGLPLLMIAGGTGACLLDWAVLTNVDRTQAVLADGSQPDLMLTIVAVVLAAGTAGLLLGSRAMAFEPAGEPRPAVRTVWMSDVTAGASWWVLQAVVAFATGTLVSVPQLILRAGPHAIVAGAATATMIIAMSAWASTGTVVVSRTGIRVRHGRFVPSGWQLGIEHIAAVHAVRVRVLLPPRLGWRSFLLRDGSALFVRTRRGGRRWITIPDAEEAATLLGGWLAERAEASED
jgi:hypothetical protein